MADKKTNHNNIGLMPLTENDKATIQLPKNFTQISNITANYIVDKTVVNAMHLVYIKELQEAIPIHCKDSVFSIFNSMNQLFFMPYDRDDIDGLDNAEEVFYDEILNEVNNWDEIEMPKDSIIDREASSSIFVDNIGAKALPAAVSADDKKDKSQNNKKPAAIKAQSKDAPTPPPKKDFSKIDNSHASELRPQVEENLNSEEMEIEKEIRQLREMKMKTEQTNKDKQLEKNSKINENTIEQQKKQKEIETKNKTADADGKIIFIKGIPLDKLNPDFISPQPVVSLIPPTTDDSKKEKELENPIIIKNGAKAKGDNNESKPIISKKKDAKQKKEGTIKLDKAEQNPIVPAGSSYDLFVAEVGVTLIENGKTKEGGNNYLSYFKKHSKYDYETMLRETIGMNSLKGTMEQIMGQTSEGEMTKDLYPPNVSGRFKVQTKEQSSSLKTSANVPNQLNFNRTQGNSLKKALDELNAVDPNVEKESQLTLDEARKSNLFKNLKNVKGKMKEESVTQAELNKTDYNKTLAVFNQTIMSNQWVNNQIKRDYNRTADLSQAASFQKPNLKNIERELGSQILNTKLPRARLRSDVRNINEDYGTLPKIPVEVQVKKKKK